MHISKDSKKQSLSKLEDTNLLILINNQELEVIQNVGFKFIKIHN